MSTLHETKRRSVTQAEFGLWVIGTVVVGLFVLPGGGAVLGLVLAFTRLKHSAPLARWGLLALGVAILSAQLIGLQAGVETHHVSEVRQVS